MLAQLPRQAVVLVGGRGTRLGAVANLIPKPLMPIRGDLRFLDVLLRNIVRNGIEEIILIAGHLGEQVKTRYEGVTIGSARLEVVLEETPAGTGGALTHAADRLDPNFLLTNGDSIFDFDYRRLLEAWRPGDIATLAVREVEDGSRYGTVDVSAGRVRAFSEKDPARLGPATISGGVYLLSRDVLDRILRLPCSIEVEVFPLLAAEDRMGAVEAEGYFLDIGLPATLDKARHELLDAIRRPATLIRVGDPGDLIAAADRIEIAHSEGRYVFVLFEAAPDAESMAAAFERLRLRRVYPDAIVVGGEEELGHVLQEYDTHIV